MIDAELLRKEPEMVKRGIAAKKADPALVNKFLELDRSWREAITSVEGLRASQKKLGEERKIEEAKAIKIEIQALEEKMGTLEKERMLVWAAIPNVPSDDTPIGKSEEENVVARKWGEPTKFDFEPKDHMALGEALGCLDMEVAGRVVGARFGYIKGDFALLEYALLQYAMDVLTNPEIIKTIADKVKPGYSAKPFVPVIPPVMIRPDVYERMARLEPKDDRYYIPSDDLYLIGSAEHTLGPLHMDEVIMEDRLPLRYVGFSPAFRREAGAAGKDTHGMLRVHQFDKVEMESFTLPEEGRNEQDFLVAIQEYLLQSLELPYQVVVICTGDMGAPDFRQIDIEAWLPAQNKYRETHTSDWNTDYQSRRLATKVKHADGKSEFVHMNDATAIAMSRMPIAIVENYQTVEGKVRVPKVLQKYLGKEIIG